MITFAIPPSVPIAAPVLHIDWAVWLGVDEPTHFHIVSFVSLLCQTLNVNSEEKMRNRNSVIMLSGLVLLLCTLAGCAVPSTPASATATAPAQVARPSNPGGPGPALDLKGDSKNGAQVFANCVPCHGDQGKGGVKNPGSTDGTVPSLNPMDATIANQDPKVFAYNIDLFVEHGSTPDGPNPTFKMAAWGDTKVLTPQQIADVIAYVMSLNK